VHENQSSAAVPYFLRAERLFPEYAEEDNAYWALAQIWLHSGNLRGAADQLIRLTQLNESDYDANVELAAMLEQLRDSAGVTRALERAVYIAPGKTSIHVHLAGMYAAQGNRAGAVRERRAVLALDPVDRAEAQYQLARAYMDAGDVPSARREVLRALEEAPSFERAQELLLEIRRKP